MSDSKVRVTQGPLRIRAESGKIFVPDELGAELRNVTETTEGTLASVIGPCPTVPTYSGGAAQPVFQQVYGVCHAKLRSATKDMLVILAALPSSTPESRLFILNGWSNAWATVGILPGSTSLAAQKFPAQFASTPDGIVCIPQSTCRPLFIDAEQAVEPLGYSRSPGGPVLLGPEAGNRPQDETPGPDTPAPKGLVNRQGYAHDGYIYSPWFGLSDRTMMCGTFGRGRLGTIISSPGDGTNPAGGDDSLGWQASKLGISPSELAFSSYNGVIQWVDKYGNLSPLSPRSNTVTFEQQFCGKPTEFEDTDPDYLDDLCSPDLLQKQILWANIEEGPRRTVGRILWRTKEIIGNASGNLYAMPPNAMPGALAFSTIPDNIATFYPDNTPDAWLVTEPVEVVPMQSFRICCMGLGAMWFANDPGDPGLVRWSMRGRWGTLPASSFIYPDPDGNEITGLFSAPQGMLIFTERSTFLVTDVFEDAHRSQKLSSHIGCVAPSSLAMTREGLVIWLGTDGFYSYDGNRVAYLSEQIRPQMVRLNRAKASMAVAAYDPTSGEYRCWVAMEASLINDVCWVFDAQPPTAGWRRRTDIAAGAVCVTKDHRQMMIASGRTGSPAETANPLALTGTNESVYTLDHSVPLSVFTPATPGYQTYLETGWLLNEDDYMQKSPLTLYFWLREESSAECSINLYRDWRMLSVESETVLLTPTNDPPPFIGTAILGSGDTIRKRRPYWARTQVFVPSCEVFKIAITSSTKVEFIGVSFDYQPKPSGGARVQP